MGKMQRTKGRAFEQKIARVLRARFPSAIVRRASQADRAHQSDVYIAGDTKLERLWIECQDARNPTPLAKLEQAEDDLHDWNGHILNRLPVVVWHRIGAREINLTTRLWVVDAIRAELKAVRDEVVTMRLEEFLDLIPSERGAA